MASVPGKVDDVANGEIDGLRRRLRTIEAEHDDERLRTQARTLFAGLIAVVALAAVALTLLAQSLGFDIARFTGTIMQASLAISALSAVILAVAVFLAMRDAEERRRDRKRLLALENTIALSAANDLAR